MKRRAMAVILLVFVAAGFLVGCGDFRRRAAEIETRIARAEESSRLAEQAAAASIARLLELEERVATVEQQLESLREAAPPEGS